MSIKDKLAIYAQVLEEEPMGKHTTYHVGGDVDYYIYPNNGTSLMRIINILESENIPFSLWEEVQIYYLVTSLFMVPSSI